MGRGSGVGTEREGETENLRQNPCWAGDWISWTEIKSWMLLMLNQQHHPGAPVSWGSSVPCNFWSVASEVLCGFCSNSTAAFDFTLYTEFFFHQDSG